MLGVTLGVMLGVMLGVVLGAHFRLPVLCLICRHDGVLRRIDLGPKIWIIPLRVVASQETDRIFNRLQPNFRL